MKTFIWINGLEARIIERETEREAKIVAENFSDHSEEVILREVKWVEDFRNRKETFQQRAKSLKYPF